MASNDTRTTRQLLEALGFAVPDGGDQDMLVRAALRELEDLRARYPLPERSPAGGIGRRRAAVHIEPRGAYLAGVGGGGSPTQMERER